MNGLPAISIVIPAYRAEATLPAALEALSQSDFSDFECIVADDHSPEPAEQLGQPGLPVRWVRLDRQGGAALARNAGAREARAGLLVFLDADVTVHPDTLGRIADALGGQPDLAAIIGSYDDEPAAPDFLSQYRNLMHCFFHRTARPRATTFWTGCGAVRRDWFLRLGGFDPAFDGIEDIEFGYRLYHAGARIALDPAIQVKHHKVWRPWNLLRTDVLSRAVPWTDLILRDRHVPTDLNTSPRQRVSVVLVWLAPVLLFAGPPAAAAALAAALLLNLEVLGFFRRKRGLWFGVRAAPWFLFYLFYSGLGFALGLARHIRKRVSKTRAASHSPE
ncbi:MAG: glycosyltransferase family 2 protein [Bryobacterales bacterium]|nr:glycosyltransferase family 2 protein [Bryobacterales bacterium]